VQSLAASAPAVLVIDDDPGLLRSFVSVLGAYGIPIATARNRNEGLAAFRWSSPAVVLTDIVMPGLEGIGTVMAMRRARPSVKIIAMSGGDAAGKSDFLTIATRLSADAVVHKPIDVDELVKLLRTLLRPSRYWPARARSVQ
jgi:DNA-binding response OmpR family regulator